MAEEEAHTFRCSQCGRIAQIDRLAQIDTKDYLYCDGCPEMDPNEEDDE